MIYKNCLLHNVEHLEEMEQGLLLQRIPEDLRKVVNDRADTRSRMPAGCEIRFKIKSGQAKIILVSEPGTKGFAEVYHGNFLLSHFPVGNAPTVISASVPENIGLLRKVAKQHGLPFSPEVTRVIPPFLNNVFISGVEGDIEAPSAQEVPGRRYLAYGSSITHGMDGIRPAGTYAMRTAELLGVDLINLGFGGGAHCEPEMADYIAGRKDWDFASLELGINMVKEFEVDEFRKRVEYFIPRIAKEHPDRFIFCIDMFTFRMDFEEGSEKNGLFRKIVADAVKKTGSPRVVHVDGRTILGNPAGLMIDLVHPAPAGMEEMAFRLSSVMKTYVAQQQS